MSLEQFESFQWDEGNESKNWIQHQVSKFEAEEVFFNEPVLLFHDSKHSQVEKRHFVLGKTDADRKLMIVFTARSRQIRVISARDMSKKERKIYERIAKV